MDTTAFLSIVIPMLNEEENVSILLNKVRQALQGKNYELILVDDGSDDDTVKEVLKHLADDLTLVELKKNYGQSLAIAAGIEEAEGDFIVTMDGDLQNNPVDILKMVKKAETEGWDLVTGIRQKRQDSLFRTFPSKVANYIIRKTTGLDIKDHGCALKVFTNKTAKSLNLYGEMHRYISLLAFLDGAKIAQIPVQHHAREHGKSKYGLERTTKVINDLILILFQQKYLQRPIHFFGNIGLFSFFIGLFICTYLLVIKFVFGFEVGGRPLLFVGILMLIVGIQFFTSGLVMDLLMRTYYESQNKHPFKVRNIYKTEPVTSPTVSTSILSDADSVE